MQSSFEIVLHREHGYNSLEKFLVLTPSRSQVSLIRLFRNCSHTYCIKKFSVYNGHIKDIIIPSWREKRQMNNQKDTQKTSIDTYEQSNVSDIKLLANRPIYEFANKKTEKLVTALYMVTDCMDTDDALKAKLRQLGVELLSDMYKLSTLSPMDKHTHISSSLARIDEILSFVEITYTIGFISEMNTTILKKEFTILISELESHLEKDKHFTFTLDEKMFELPELSSAKQDFNYANQHYTKDTPIGQTGKRTPFNVTSFINNKSLLQTSQLKKTTSHSANLAERQERTNKIISIIKDLSTLPAPEGQAEKKDVSIKDISLVFTDCSEKTIQRELNSLVLKGQLRKIGAKRWSRYSII